MSREQAAQLPAAVTRVEHELFIRSFFAETPPAAVATQLAARMNDVFFEPGEVLYSAGEQADSIFFVASGTVRLEAEGQEPWVFQDDAMIGILDAALGRPYARTAVAVTETQALVMAFEDFLEILEEHFAFAMLTLKLNLGMLFELARKLAPDEIFPKGIYQTSSVAGHPGIFQRELNPVERLLVLRQTPLFERAPVQALSSLGRLAHDRVFAKGESVYRIGDATDRLYVIVAGQVRLSGGDPEVRATFGPCRLLGAFSTLGCERYPHHAIATEESLCIELKKEDFFDVAEDHSGLLRAAYAYSALERERVMRTLASRHAERTSNSGVEQTSQGRG